MRSATTEGNTTARDKSSSVSKPRRLITPSLIQAVCERLAANKPVRRTLPVQGRLHIDRQLPFLCVYRQPAESEDPGTEHFVSGEASYLVAPDERQYQEQVSTLVRRVVETLAAEFGAFLIIEVWAAPDGGKATDPAVPTVLPTFTIHGPSSATMTRTIDALARRLKKVKVLKQSVNVEVIRDGASHPPAMSPLLPRKEARELNCSFLGIAVPPVYRKANSSQLFPMLARNLRRSVGLALRQTYFEFSRSRTTHRPPHYHSLGRNAVVKAVWEVDRQLAAVSNQFDYLLLLTPVNPRGAWKQFEHDGMEVVPDFHYRPLPVDPDILKRELYKVRIERVEDPALHRLFQEKRGELETKLSMLRDRDTPRFLHESMQLFGGADDELIQSARGLLERLSNKRKGDPSQSVDAVGFARRVDAECDFYRQLRPEFKGAARVTNDVGGLIVSRGRLHINADLKIPETRIEALLAHEVGTHLLTYYNGRMQPFQQLYSGLAGYEELQEGLAVLSEYLVGGLTANRMRQLAGRVVAVRHLTDGASFVDTYRALHVDLGFPKRTAYNVTMRVYRGGGMTKDAVYLRGLQGILHYLQRGGDLAPLLIGKIAIDHIPIIKELQYRKVLKPAPLVPRHLEHEGVKQRLERLRGNGASLVDLVSPGASQ